MACSRWKCEDDKENVMTSQMSRREQGASGIGHKAIDIDKNRQGSTRDHGHSCRHDYLSPCQTPPEPVNKNRMSLAPFVHPAFSFLNELEAFTISSHHKVSTPASFSGRSFQGPNFSAPDTLGQSSHHLFISHLIYLLIPSYKPSPEDMDIGDVGETKDNYPSLHSARAWKERGEDKEVKTPGILQQAGLTCASH